MHIAILAQSETFAESVLGALGPEAHRYTIVQTWPELESRLHADRPALIVVHRLALGRIPLGDLAQVGQPGVWPPLLIAGDEIARVTQSLGAAGRLAQAEPSFYQLGELRIDTRRKRARVGDRWVGLPPIQYRLLLTLARRAGEVLNAQELLRIVWGYDASASEARELVKVHIRQIRRRLGPTTHQYIRSVRGFGYVLTSPDAEDD